jgi:hypothetical protein
MSRYSSPAHPRTQLQADKFSTDNRWHVYEDSSFRSHYLLAEIAPHKSALSHFIGTDHGMPPVKITDNDSNG